MHQQCCTHTAGTHHLDHVCQHADLQPEQTSSLLQVCEPTCLDCGGRVGGMGGWGDGGGGGGWGWGGGGGGVSQKICYVRL